MICESLLKAKESSSVRILGDFIEVNGSEVSFKMQSAPMKEVGVDGLQVKDILRYVIELLRTFNDEIPCRENSITITKLQEAVMWQNERTSERSLRDVEGTMNK